MRRWFGFGKSKVIFRRKERAEKWTKRKGRAGGGKLGLVGSSLHCFPTLAVTAAQSPSPPKAGAPCVFTAVRTGQEWEYHTTCKTHTYRANLTSTWRWLSSLLSTWGLRQSSLRWGLLPAPPSLVGPHCYSIPKSNPPPLPHDVCVPHLLSSTTCSQARHETQDQNQREGTLMHWKQDNKHWML